MESQFRFVFIILCCTVVLIFTVYLHSSGNRIFYKICTTKTEQNYLKQQLWQKQLQLESLTNPAAISNHLKQQ